MPDFKRSSLFDPVRHAIARPEPRPGAGLPVPPPPQLRHVWDSPLPAPGTPERFRHDTRIELWKWFHSLSAEEQEHIEAEREANP